MAHDVGKATRQFIRRLEGDTRQVDHSTPGAQVINSLYPSASVGKLLGYVVAGHHAGLPDGGTVVNESSLAARLRKELPEQPAASVIEHVESLLPDTLTVPQRFLESGGFGISFFVRMLYSAVVDADFIDTETFMSPSRVAMRQSSKLADLLPVFRKYMSALQVKRPTGINVIRSEIYEECVRAADADKGLFSLTVPTGGGKTLSSYGFAAAHADKHKMSRIIYVIPYTSIIEQTADVFRKAVGEEAVLEHHDNFSGKSFDAELVSRWELLSENWDTPVIVTTGVQFYESLFSNRSSSCRKLHNIANSVIILDEAQLIPVYYLLPILAAIGELIKNYGCSVLLCTATQPEIGEYLPVVNPATGQRMPITEIISAPEQLQHKLKRVKVKYAGRVSDAQLVEELSKREQVLCVVNTRKHARVLYEMMPDKENAFHLSTCMCPAHRKAVLDEIKRRLLAGEHCRVISTQLVEAGVDIDFPAVYRSMAGLDSIAQAAGRCNREGKLACGDVAVFDTTNPDGMPFGWLQTTADCGRVVLKRHLSDPLSLEAMKEYFTLVYTLEKRKLDKEDILPRLREGASSYNFPFASIARDFRIIDEAGVNIVVPWNEEAKSLVEKVRKGRGDRSVMRKLQAYTVNVWDKVADELEREGKIESVDGEGAVLVLKEVGDVYGETGINNCLI